MYIAASKRSIVTAYNIAVLYELYASGKQYPLHDTQWREEKPKEWGQPIVVTTIELVVTTVESVRDSKSERTSLLNDTIVRVKL